MGWAECSGKREGRKLANMNSGTGGLPGDGGEPAATGAIKAKIWLTSPAATDYENGPGSCFHGALFGVFCYFVHPGAAQCHIKGTNSEHS